MQNTTNLQGEENEGVKKGPFGRTEKLELLWGGGKIELHCRNREKKESFTFAETKSDVIFASSNFLI